MTLVLLHWTVVSKLVNHYTFWSISKLYLQISWQLIYELCYHKHVLCKQLRSGSLFTNHCLALVEGGWDLIEPSTDLFSKLLSKVWIAVIFSKKNNSYVMATSRSSRLQMFFKMGVLKNFAIFKGKQLRWSLFLIFLICFSVKLRNF